MHVPQLAVVLIGTNDLGNADCTETEADLLRAVPGIVDRMDGILAALSTAPHVAIVGILPRGATFWVAEQTWAWPNRYTQAIKYVNLGYTVRHCPPASMLVSSLLCWPPLRTMAAQPSPFHCRHLPPGMPAASHMWNAASPLQTARALARNLSLRGCTPLQLGTRCC